MTHLLDRLLRLYRSAAIPAVSGAPPDAALLLPSASLASHVWLAPHAVRYVQGATPSSNHRAAPARSAALRSPR